MIIQGIICHFSDHLNSMTFTIWSKSRMSSIQRYCMHICSVCIVLAQIRSQLVQCKPRIITDIKTHIQCWDSPCIPVHHYMPLWHTHGTITIYANQFKKKIQLFYSVVINTPACFYTFTAWRILFYLNVFGTIRYESQNFWSRNTVSNRRKEKFVLCSTWKHMGSEYSSLHSGTWE